MLGKIPVAILILLNGSISALSIDDSMNSYLTPDTDFADYLYSSGLWDRAATEYLRAIHGSGGDTLLLPMPALRLARCWYELGDHRASLNMFAFLAEGLEDPDLKAFAMMGAGSVLETDGDYTGARTFYLMASSETSDPDIRDRSRILAALSAGSSGDWTRAESELRGVASMDGPGSELAASIAMISAEGDHLPHRSPFWCAGASALLPGSGQAICGNTGDGLVALGTNLLLGYLFIASLEEEDTATSVLFGWLSISFYGANIYGGARAASGYNSARRTEFIDRLEQILENGY